jgi:hypothetical protein
MANYLDLDTRWSSMVTTNETLVVHRSAVIPLTQLWWIVADFPAPQSEFGSGIYHVALAVDKDALGQVSS